MDRPVVVRDIVAVILEGGRLKRHQPYGGDTHSLQIVQTAHQTLKVSDSVAVGIYERDNRQATDNRVLVPEILDHSGDLSISEFHFQEHS